MNPETNKQLERICGLINQGMDAQAVCPYLLSHAIASEPYPINPPPLSAEIYLRAMEQLVTVIRAMVEEWTPPDEVKPLVDIVEQLAGLSDCTTPLQLERLIADAQQVMGKG